MATLKLSPKFFRKERDNLYSDWKTAFWREMLQNSLDAGASAITINIKHTGDKTLVAFYDNGCGMTRDVIENVFFSLGETTKDTDATVGGFGRARILTCFAMESYTFRTGKLMVTGQGAEYEIADAERNCRGCEFDIAVGDVGNLAMIDALGDVLSRSQIDDCEVVLNGIRWSQWMHRRRLTRQIDCGGVYVNKSQMSNSRIVVRVKGLYMFDVPTNTRDQVIVEIDTALSRKVLTANRDGMHHRYQNNLTQFLAEIAVDKRSALRSRDKKTVLIQGSGLIISRGKASKKAEKELQDRIAASISVGPVVAPAQAPASVPVGVAKEEVIEGKTFARELPSIYLLDEAENPKVIRVIPNFNPENWTHAVKNVRGRQQRYRKGSTYLKLLLAWREACELAVQALMKIRGMEEALWMIGWNFGGDSDAMCCSVGGGKAFCLNPVDSDGNLRFKLRDRASLMRVMSLAKHEVAHYSQSLHDEDFSSLHTDIDAAFDSGECLRRMRLAIASVN